MIFRALFYLRITSAKNWALSRVRRLRQPKYLIGAIVGAAYFWFFILRRVVISPASISLGHSPRGFEGMSVSMVLVQVIVLMAIGRLILAWIAPDKPGLVFSEAEIAFLFPAPVSRRGLIHYKLLGTQLTILFSALLVTVLSNRWNALGGNVVTHAVGWWIIFSTINLHTLGAAFTVSRLVDRGVSRRLRQAVVFGVILLLVGSVGYVIWQSVPAPTERDLHDASTLMKYAGNVTNTGALRWLLWPVHLVAGPFFAATWKEFFLALGPALLALGLHYFWVMRGETSFEEASIAMAEKRARLAAARTGNNPLATLTHKARRGAFPLSSAGGRPEVAFLWKNLLSTRAFLNHRTFLATALVIIGLNAWLSHGSASQRAALGLGGVFSLIIAAYTILLGPQFARQDLRNDLANIDLLKTYPLRGWQVVLGELLTPVAILTGVLWLTLLAGTLGLAGLRQSDAFLPPPVRATVAGCLAVIAPIFCLLQLMVPNAATLLFPSWAQASRSRERGIDVMGQRLIFVGGQLLMIICALLPAALLGVLLWFATHLFMSQINSSIVAASGVLAVLLGEICLGLWWLGHRFEAFDLSSESIK